MAPGKRTRSKRPATTLQSLPPELIASITDWIEVGHTESVRLAAGLQGLQELGGMGENEDGPADPAAFLAALGGLMGAAVGQPAAANGAAARGAVPAAGPAPAPAQPAGGPNGTGLNPYAPPFNFNFNAPAQPNPANAPPVVAPAAGPFTFGGAANAGANTNPFGFNFNLPPFNRPGAAAPSSATANAAADSDDEMPALEPIEGASDPEGPALSAPIASTSSVPIASTSSAPSASSRPAAPPSESDSDEMPPLEPIQNDETAGLPSAPIVAAAGDPDSAWEDDEDDDEDDDYEDDDDGEYDSDPYGDGYSESSDEETYADGLPLDPLLPLLFISREFLHAARSKLYRRISILSPWQASMLLRSFQEPRHAARIEAEDVEDPDGPRNHLPSLVRAVHISGKGECSLGRGGASVYFELLGMCNNLEELAIYPSMLKSATKPFFETLKSLKNLKRADLGSGVDPDKPLLITTARIYELMHEHWLKMEDLAITGLKSAADGGIREEDEMWLTSGAQDVCREEHGSDDIGVHSGLKTFSLVNPDADYDEISMLLKDSAKTLTKLTISRPSDALTPYGIGNIVLTFGANLTHFTIDIAAGWSPQPKLTTKLAFPFKPAEYKAGQPTHKEINAIARYTYLLDALLPYLPHVQNLAWTGDIASTSLFSFLPPSLKTIWWSRSPSIKPGPLAKLLRKSVTRQKVVTNPDGTTTKKPIQTIVAKGLQCITITGGDELNWSETDLSSFEEAAWERGCCLHLSSGSTGGAGVTGAGVFPFGLGGLGGLGGFGGLGGLVAPIPAQPAAAGPAPAIPRGATGIARAGQGNGGPAGGGRAPAATPGGGALGGGGAAQPAPAPAPAQAQAPASANGGVPRLPGLALNFANLFGLGGGPGGQ